MDLGLATRKHAFRQRTARFYGALVGVGPEVSSPHIRAIRLAEQALRGKILAVEAAQDLHERPAVRGQMSRWNPEVRPWSSRIAIQALGRPGGGAHPVPANDHRVAKLGRALRLRLCGENAGQCGDNAGCGTHHQKSNLIPKIAHILYRSSCTAWFWS